MMSSLGPRLLKNSASVSTRFQSGSNPARRNSRSTSSASLGLSSTSRTRIGCDFLSIHFRRLIQEQPIHTQVLHSSREPFEINGFHDIAVDSELVALHYVLLFLGRSQHHDWDSLCARLALDPPQGFA